MTNIKIKLFCLLAVIVAFNACKKKNAGNDANVTAKQAAINNYNNIYLPTNNKGTYTWNGSVANCDPGTLPADLLNKVKQRVNYFRSLAGLPPVAFSATYNSECQQDALMMLSNNLLSHGPDSTWKCYTKGGATAAGASNLAVNSAGLWTSSVDQWMGEQGADLGHRRWIINSTPGDFGYGCTGNWAALYVITYAKPTASIPEFIPWPASGYMPFALLPAEPQTWSISVPGGDFTNATVSMTDSSGAAVSTTPVPTADGFGDNAMAWAPASIVKSISGDYPYHVTVSNVMVNGVSKTFSYNVILFKTE